MYHPYRKDSTWLRQALYDVYQKKCVYCGTLLQPRHMQVDHIMPTNPESFQDNDIAKYLEELEQDGFVQDSIENYLPSCSACNSARKSNHVYAATNLRHFHEVAKRNLNKVLKRIEELKTKQTESFFEPLDPELWEELDFTYQRGISHAIMGYRLTPADVVACPRFPQVERIQRQLDIVDYVLLQGEPGCGKSISVYQVAYDLYQSGWPVYRLRAKEGMQSIPLPNNTIPSLYIVDDAQLFPTHIIETLAEQARPNAKVIIAMTVSSIIRYDAILLTNQDAVNLLYKDFLQRKKELIPIVHQADHRISTNSFDTPIEWRLRNACKATTPWQFNYILRGGWQSMKERYLTICTHHNCDLLVAAIAVFQVVHLDHSVNYDFLCTQLKSFDSNLNWNQDDLIYLVNQGIVISKDDVRIVHMESANVVIAQFLSHGIKDKKDILYKAVEDSFLSGQFSVLGLVWLCNGLRGYTIPFSAQNGFISERIITFALEHISTLSAPQDRRNTAFFLEKVFNMRYPHNGCYFFETQESIWLDWINHANSENAYAYSMVLNTLYNENKKAYAKFVRQVDWPLLMDTMCHEKNPNWYAWSKLIDRLAICKASKAQTAAFEAAIRDVRSSISTGDIDGFSDLLSRAGHCIPSCVHETIPLLAPVYQNYFRQNMEQGLDFFDFEFFWTICGINLLGGHRATSAEKNSAATIVAVLPDIEFSDVIANSLPRKWRQIHEVLCLISKYDRGKAKRIIHGIDLKQLSVSAKDAWMDNRDIDCLCIALYLGSPSTARHFIEINQSEITTMHSALIGIAPKCAVTLFQKGVPLNLIGDHGWNINVWALQEVFKADKITAQAALASNYSQIVEQLNNLSAYALEDNGCIQFLQLTKQCAPDVWTEIVRQVDFEQLSHCLDRCTVAQRKKKGIAKRLSRLIKMFESARHEYNI